MTDINNIVLTGRLTKDGTENQFRYVRTNTAVMNFSIAVNKSRKQADGSYASSASFIDCTIFGKTAENMKQYFRKGGKVAVVGSLEQQTWTNKDGSKGSKIVVIVSNVQLLSWEKQNPQDVQTNAPNVGYTQNPQYTSDMADFDNDSVPF
jgi:single-strand DNA-binding protein